MAHTTDYAKHIHRWIAEFGNTFVCIEDDVQCNVCDVKLHCRQKCILANHVSSQKHIAAVNQPIKGDFCHELCTAFAAANISLYKLQNPILKSFLEKFTNRHVPDPSTLRRYYMPKLL